MTIAGVLAVVAAVISAVIFVWWKGGALLPYHTEAYRGDGTITDGGRSSYPRYRISLPEVFLTETHRHIYSIEHVPAANFMFGLDVVNLVVQDRKLPSHDFGSVRNDLSVAITVRITDARGRTIYARSSKVQEWQLSVSADRTYLWFEGYFIGLSRGQAYRLDLEFAAENVNAARVLVKPFLSGGGSELP
jgi:hypothetical protein